MVDPCLQAFDVIRGFVHLSFDLDSLEDAMVYKLVVVLKLAHELIVHQIIVLLSLALV